MLIEAVEHLPISLEILQAVITVNDIKNITAPKIFQRVTRLVELDVEWRKDVERLNWHARALPRQLRKLVCHTVSTEFLESLHDLPSTLEHIHIK